MVISAIQYFRKGFLLRDNMTVSIGAGTGRVKEPGNEFSGVISFKMSAMKEVLKRRNQIGSRIKMRLRTNMRREESRIEEEFQMKKLDQDLKKMRKEIQDLIKKAKKLGGDVPVVKIRLQVTFPKKSESVLLRPKDVKADRMMRMGIPGAVSLEKAVACIQAQVNDVRKIQSSMLDEVGKLLNTMQMADI